MKKINLRFIAAVVTLVFAHLAWPGLSLAEYPEKPVILICAFAAGEPMDTTARTIAEMAKKHFPQPLVVVNRPGAAGTIGAAEAIRAKPDGYTIGITGVSALAVQPHRTKLPYGPPDDYTPIIRLVNLPQLLVVKSTSPWKNAKEFIDYSKKNPGKIRVAHSGLGTISQIDMEQLKEAAKVDLTLVPFSGSADSVLAVLGGHVDAAIVNPPPVIPHFKAGTVRPIGVFEEDRNEIFPDTPTFKELGYDITMGIYFAIIGPKGLPTEITGRIHEAVKKSLEEPAFAKMMKESGSPIAYEGPEALSKRLHREYKQNRKFVEALKTPGKK